MRTFGRHHNRMMPSLHQPLLNKKEDLLRASARIRPHREQRIRHTQNSKGLFHTATTTIFATMVGYRLTLAIYD